MLPSQSTHEFPGDAWISIQAPLMEFVLLLDAQRSCQLVPAPSMELSDAPVMATSLPQAPTEVLLKASVSAAFL